MRSAVDQEIRDLIQKNGRITFAQYMQACLYSPRGAIENVPEQMHTIHFCKRQLFDSVITLREVCDGDTENRVSCNINLPFERLCF